jgi:hypothetical protein
LSRFDRKVEPGLIVLTAGKTFNLEHSTPNLELKTAVERQLLEKPLPKSERRAPSRLEPLVLQRAETVLGAPFAPSPDFCRDFLEGSALKIECPRFSN